jgi:hypothetical protein
MLEGVGEGLVGAVALLTWVGLVVQACCCEVAARRCSAGVPGARLHVGFLVRNLAGLGYIRRAGWSHFYSFLYQLSGW